jgi:hypothetical protein
MTFSFRKGAFSFNSEPFSPLSEASPSLSEAFSLNSEAFSSFPEAFFRWQSFRFLSDLLALDFISALAGTALDAAGPLASIE